MLHAGPGRLRRSLAPAAKSVAVSEIALTGVYEISKILTSAHRLETTLSNVVNLLASFMQMRHGVIVLLDHDGIPDIVVGAGWSEEFLRALSRTHAEKGDRPSHRDRNAVSGTTQEAATNTAQACAQPDKADKPCRGRSE